MNYFYRGQNFNEILDLLAQFKKGYVSGVHVRLGKLQVRKLFLDVSVVIIRLLA